MSTENARQPVAGLKYDYARARPCLLCGAAVGYLDCRVCRWRLLVCQCAERVRRAALFARYGYLCRQCGEREALQGDFG